MRRCSRNDTFCFCFIPLRIYTCLIVLITIKYVLNVDNKFKLIYIYRIKNHFSIGTAPLRFTRNYLFLFCDIAFLVSLLCASIKAVLIDYPKHFRLSHYSEELEEIHFLSNACSKECPNVECLKFLTPIQRGC